LISSSGPGAILTVGRDVDRAKRAPEAFTALGLLAIVALAARSQTFGNPVLGFDEQFYLLVGDRMLQGATPYVDIFDRKPIGLFLIYAGARLLGGDGFVQYKLMAACFATGTAWAIFLLARRHATRFGATAAAATYLLWLDFMEGEGGQASVLYAYPMVLAANAVAHAAAGRGRTRRFGAAAMAAVGLATQVKYSVLIEGIYFGCALLWLGRRDGEKWDRLIASAAMWIACAALPTALALAWYAGHGHAHEFLFCNFASVLGQQRRPIATELAGLAIIAGIVAPLLAGVVASRPWRDKDAVTGVIAGWLIASIASLLAYGRFDSPHYGIPPLIPCTILLAPALDGARRRRTAIIASLGVVWAVGQTVLAVSEREKGGREAALAVAAAARPAKGCIYIYDGYPALYMQTHSCLPTRWAFPGHLATVDEASSAALGVDPVAEVARILAAHPDAIVDDFPRFAFGNPATRRILEGALAEHYHLAACIPTGHSRIRLVYRRGPGNSRAPSACPHTLVS